MYYLLMLSFVLQTPSIAFAGTYTFTIIDPPGHAISD
jgi:hypothetical protein